MFTVPSNYGDIMETTSKFHFPVRMAKINQWTADNRCWRREPSFTVGQGTSRNRGLPRTHPHWVSPTDCPNVTRGQQQPCHMDLGESGETRCQASTGKTAMKKAEMTEVFLNLRQLK